MDRDPHLVPVARIFYRDRDCANHGWYVQHYVGDELRTTRLEVRHGAERDEVITEAAGYIGCIPSQVQVEGIPWPAEQLAM